MESWSEFERDGVHLVACDFGGDEPSVVLLHGLAGYAGEWAETASWLIERARVIAFDTRGHGASDRSPSDVSRAAYVDDVIFLIEQMTDRPVVLIGQSLGGGTAFLVAAKRPDLVRGLIMAEAAPSDGKGTNLDNLEVALSRWPIPFRSRDSALAYFGGRSLPAEAWVGGLEERDGGLWPRFDVAVMVETLRLAHSESNWSEWRLVQCPTLVVRAENGIIPKSEVEAMIAQLPHARSTQIAEAQHDLHLDRPGEWRVVVEGFLDRLERK
jgi:pimeloyl-ACP methyl ester carboxylesterase